MERSLRAAHRTNHYGHHTFARRHGALLRHTTASLVELTAVGSNAAGHTYKAARRLERLRINTCRHKYNGLHERLDSTFLSCHNSFITSTNQYLRTTIHN
jgi:hypothetical protein